ncbi:hypothetical protein GE107_25385 [Cohnella sp. CFH 77786]|uniref:hypothetical protein n=1 Tax=Cohnella sp. CFH 77786 TaxID=2662265 RepID=UPI001C60EF69|nr:hypothetical protein [Cohnella sp. CFH 77786]MBW5449364.1 hypothetical protein [Cohnella sp. CFH 77786]
MKKKLAIVTLLVSLFLTASTSAFAADNEDWFKAIIDNKKLFDQYIEKGHYQNGEMRIFLTGTSNEVRPDVPGPSCDGCSVTYPYIYRGADGEYKTGLLDGYVLRGNFYIGRDALADFPLFKSVTYKPAKKDTEQTEIDVAVTDDVYAMLGSVGHDYMQVNGQSQLRDEFTSTVMANGHFPLRWGLSEAGIQVAYSKSEQTIYVGNVPSKVAAEEQAK